MKGRKFISALKFYSDYSKWNDKESRYENWEEACEAVINETHKVKYHKYLPQLDSYLTDALDSYKSKLILASQRNLQYRGEQIFKNNSRLFNCSALYCDKVENFGKVFHLLLSGCGVGISFLNHWVEKLPILIPRDAIIVKNFIIPDSVEGWAEAANVLLSSFCAGVVPSPEYQGAIVRFDYSQIRLKGSFISGGFKAPGPKGLKQSLERIEDLLEKETQDGCTKFRSIVAYDVFMHLADAVLSGGIRRAALSIIVDQNDTEMINAKIGDWRTHNKQRSRSNNSIGLIRGQFTYQQFLDIVKMNNELSDIGFVFMDSIYTIFNPCYEIGMSPILDFENEITGISLCNLTSVNANACRTNGKFDEKKFYRACRDAAVLGTLQAGYTDLPFLGSVTEEIVKREALIGVSIAGWMNSPELFNEEILKKGAEIVKQVNEEISSIIGINPAARMLCTKPDGNSSTILMCAPGIHPEHSKRYFRIMQVNKGLETAQWLLENVPDMIEESAWSSTNSDYVVYTPITNDDTTLFKSDMIGVTHLEKIKFAQEHWVNKGKVIERCIRPETSHNISCTVIVEDYDEVAKYIFDNQYAFTAVSFVSNAVDKDYSQAPYTSVLTSQELLDKYGDGVMFASGLIVDGLHYYDNNLWEACSSVLNRDKKFEGTRTEVLLKKDWVRRAKQFAKNYFKNDLDKTVYCLKDVHLWYKWNKISKTFKEVDFEQILTKPSYNDVDKYSAVACSGGQCELI